MEAVSNFIFWGSKIKSTVDNDCSYEIKRCSLLGRKAMKNLDSVKRGVGYYSNCHFAFEETEPHGG